MKCITNFLSENATAITALATFVIALFTVLMWWVSRRIHQASLQRDKEMTDLYLNIMASIIISGKCVGETKLSTRLLEEQKKELLQLFGTSEQKRSFSCFSFFRRLRRKRLS